MRRSPRKLTNTVDAEHVEQPPLDDTEAPADDDDTLAPSPDENIIGVNIDDSQREREDGSSATTTAQGIHICRKYIK